jgi:diacylglycerol kinase family enzyme
MSFTVFINENSGSVATHGAEALSQKLQDSLSTPAGNIRFFPPADFEAALQKADPGAPLLVGGGDGTIRTAAAILKDRKIPFGILPLGTMNLFAKDLSLEPDLFKLAESYRKFDTVQIDAASVNGELFLCNAMVGIPLEIAKQREKSRNAETLLTWLALAKKGLEKLSSPRGHLMALSYEGVTEEKHIKAVIIANNEYEEAGEAGTFKKKSLTDGKLSIYTVNPEGTLESILLLSKLALGDWQNANGLEVFETTALKLRHKAKINVLLDGEVYTLKGPLSFRCHPGALHIMVPKG